MNIPNSRGWLAAVLVAALCGTALWAAQPVMWRQHSFDDFEAGEAAGVTVTSDGAVELGPELGDLSSLQADRVWSLAAGPDRSVFVGSGDDGRVFQVTDGGDTSLVFDSPEVSIHALAVDADGVLYAGTAPEGLIYRIQDGEAEIAARTGAFYVWDLGFDDKGRLLAATGEMGRVLTVSSDGEVDTLAALTDRHVMAMAHAEGRLYVATADGDGEAADEEESQSGHGRIYEIEGDGRARLAYEAADREISRLTAGEGGDLFASSLKVGEQGSHSAVIHLNSAGVAVPIWETEGVVFDLAWERGGSLLVAVDDPGRLYRLYPQTRRLALVAHIDTLAPHRLLVSPQSGQVVIGAAHAGRLLTLGGTAGRDGHFDSSARDFHINSRWGRLDWRASLPKGTSISFKTRSGNSREPDDSWSAWSRQMTRPGRVESPPARFLQYRALLTSREAGVSPVLEEVSIAARQANLRPRISELTITPYRSGQSSNGGRDRPAVAVSNQSSRDGRSRMPQRKSLRMVRWKAEDPNGDKLSYDLYLRGADQQEWKLVEENASQTSLVWDTETMPEGVTRMKLVASDQLGNGVGEVLRDERVSDPFLLDNSPPTMTVKIESDYPVRILVSIDDAISAIRRAQYTIDYGDEVFPLEALDGVFDYRREQARFTVEDLPPGEHVIALQVWDRLDNVGVRQIVVQSD